jgi:hypothetical protein
MREESVDKTHLIDNKKAEGQTYQSGNQSQAAIEANKAVFRKRKWDGNRGCDQHHPRDGTDPKYQEI